MSPQDALDRGVRSGQQVTIRSRRGTVTATLFVTPTLRPGQVFLPMHDARVNALTAPGFDPQSRQPAYKHTAVEVLAAGRD
jgi:assimilatory nitrate reductase catalytic subunit